MFHDLGSILFFDLTAAQVRTAGRLSGVTLVRYRFEPGLSVCRMASSSNTSKVAELEAKLKGLEELKTTELKKAPQERDGGLLLEINKDLDRIQTAVTALYSSEFPFLLLTFSSIIFGIVCLGHPAGFK